jgi:hypothetical protein
MEAVNGGGGALEVADAVLAVVDEECVNRLAAQLVADTRLRTMDFRKGANLEMSVAREVSATWVAAARTMLTGAPNYSETLMEFGIPEDPQRYAFTVQKVGKLTPHQARRQAEDERDEALAEVERLRDQLEAGDEH